MAEPIDPASRGIFDGFEAYQTPAPEEYHAVMTGGLVVMDANVLLDLYRYTRSTREDLFRVLKLIGQNLWIPDQIVVEFWRNRESTMQDRSELGGKIRGDLDKHRATYKDTLQRWFKRVALPEHESTALLNTLDRAFSSVDQALNDFDKGEEVFLDTNEDPVLRSLIPLLYGRIGSPLDQDDYRKAIDEGKRRIAAQIPPGYMDKRKDDQHAVGDYLVWEQILRQAERMRTDVLLVTGDVKEDWWRLERRQTRGPRPELVNELMERAKVRLYMMRPDTLLKRAKEAFGIDISNRSLQNVRSVETQFDGHLYEVAVEQALSRNEYVYSRMAADGPFDLMVQDLGGGTAFLAFKFARSGPLRMDRIQPIIELYQDGRARLGCLVVTNAPLSEELRSFNSKYAGQQVPVEVITWSDANDDGLLVRALARTTRAVPGIKLTFDDDGPHPGTK